MGTITQRRRKDGAAAFTAQIRIMKNGEKVYQESQALDRKATAQVWLRKREAELQEPGRWKRQTAIAARLLGPQAF